MIQKGHYHLAGVAGVGMSGVAQAVLAQGCDVSGSDRYCDKGEELEVVEKLRAAGIRFCPQDGSGLGKDTLALVVSTAIEKDNADVAAAMRLGVPVVHRAEMLGRLVEGKRCVAVTGTSGKSTVTGMIGWILHYAGLDPTVVNGAVVLNWRTGGQVGNVRIGASDIWVIEADESDRSLMQFKPDWAVITNASIDHFGFEETVELFRSFRRQVKSVVVSAFDNPGFFDGFQPDLSAGGSSFVYGGESFNVPLPGRHNADNALHAIRLCEKLGIELSVIAEALAQFKGIHRRLELVGAVNDITVIDDYGHNPAKIDAAWRAIAPYRKRVLAVWRPHGYKPLAVMMDELVEVIRRFCRADDCFYVLPIYDAGGTADRSIKADVLVAKLVDKKIRAKNLPEGKEGVEILCRNAQPGDAVLIMGARDPGLPAFARSVLAAVAGKK